MKLTTTLILLVSCVVFAQNPEREIDSLLRVAETSSDSIWYDTHKEIGFYYIFNKPERAAQLIEKGLDRSRTKNDVFWETQFIYTKGVLKDVTGDLDSARIYFNQALKLSRDNNFNHIIIKTNNGLGMNHWNRREYDPALKFFFDALEGNKISGKTQDNAKYLNNIGLIYQEMNLFDKALEYHFEALEIRKQYNISRDIPTSLNNIAICYREKGELEKALNTSREAMDMAKKENMTTIYYDAVSTLSNIYATMEEPDLAIPLLEELLAHHKTQGGISAFNLTPISNIINAYNSKNQPRKAREYIEDAEDLFKVNKDLKKVSYEYYFNSAQTYFMLGQPKKGVESTNRGLHIKDSIFSADNAISMAKMETKFKVSEKERDLAKARANLAETQLEIKQRNNMIYGSLGLAFFLGLLGYLFYNQQRLKNNQLQKEGELKDALARIETQNKLQEQRLRISRDLHDNIGSQLTFVTSSVDNLKFGLRDKDDMVTQKLGKISDFTTQTIYELRDTIWAMNKTEISFEDLQTRIANFIDNATMASEDIKFTFEVDETVNRSQVFTSIQGMNIYRIIQEGINNALKYAEASEIKVLISKKDQKFYVEILDNGVGFDINETTFGNGLHNMEKRAKDIGGDLTYTAKVGEGTRLMFNF